MKPRIVTRLTESTISSEEINDALLNDFESNNCIGENIVYSLYFVNIKSFFYWDSIAEPIDPLKKYVGITRLDSEILRIVRFYGQSQKIEIRRLHISIYNIYHNF